MQVIEPSHHGSQRSIQLNDKPLPQFISDILASPPRSGDGFHNWLFRAARVLHPWRNESDIYATLRFAAEQAGRHVAEREIRDAITNSAEVAWKPDESFQSSPRQQKWPPVDEEQRQAIDPALSFLGGDNSSQKDVGGFLRNGLNPLLQKYGCGCIVIHHTNKPPTGKEKSGWAGGDFAYSGAGSAEWANWARAVVAMRSIGQHDVFELHLGKRGSRVGWKGSDESTSYARYIAHSKEPGVICWREASVDEVNTTGAPRRHTVETLLDALGDESMTTNEWRKAADQEHGVGRSSFFTLKKAAVTEGKVFLSKVDQKWNRK